MDENAGESTEDRAAKARAQMLFARWLKGGRLNVPELREIRALMGEDAYRRALNLLGVSVDDAESASGTSERASYQHDYAHYAVIFKRSTRQLKRYVAVGKAADPPELPPFDDPPKVHVWWIKHMTQAPPKRVIELALEERTGKGAPAVASGDASKSIDVTQLNVAEGEQLKQARGFLAGCALLLQQAYLSGNDGEIDRLQRRWEKAANAVRLAENSERAAKKQSGELIPASELFPDLSELLATVRVMRTSMSRRIRARLSLPPEWDAKLDAVIEAERRGEEAVLRRLSFFRDLQRGENELELVA